MPGPRMPRAPAPAPRPPDAWASPLSPRVTLVLTLAAWIALAIGVAVTTLAKRDSIAFHDYAAPKLLGRIIARDATGVTARVDTPSGPADRFVPAAEARVVAPYGERSVTGVYRHACELWWARRPLYTEGAHGFLYLPQAALVFAPFAALPPALGEVLWRWAGLAACALGLWRLCQLVFGPRALEAFFPATLIGLWSLLGSAQNGQTNLVMAGLFALAAADAASDKRWRCTLWLMLALACKPVALPVVLLLGATKPRMLPHLAAGLALFALSPFLHTDLAYVWSQYAQAPRKILDAGSQETSVFSDVRGLLIDLGLAPDAWKLTLGRVELDALLLARAAAAGLALLVSLIAAGRHAEPARSLLVVALGVTYILLFNPRTEGVTYALAGPWAGLLAARALLRDRWIPFALLLAYALALQFSMQVTGPVQSLAERLGLLAHDAPDHKYWLRPLLTFAFAAYLVRLMLRPDPLWPRPSSAAPQPVPSPAPTPAPPAP